MIKATCPRCHHSWQLSPQSIRQAAAQAPKNSKSISVICPRCRKTVKVARPRHIPAEPPVDEEA